MHFSICACHPCARAMLSPPCHHYTCLHFSICACHPCARAMLSPPCHHYTCLHFSICALSFEKQKNFTQTPSTVRKKPIYITLHKLPLLANITLHKLARYSRHVLYICLLILSCIFELKNITFQQAQFNFTYI